MSVRWRDWEDALKRSWEAALAYEPRLGELFGSRDASIFSEGDQEENDPLFCGVWVTGDTETGDSDLTPTAWFGVEAVDFDEDDQPRWERGLMVSLDVAFHRRRGAHLKPAVDRVEAALVELHDARSASFPYRNNPDSAFVGDAESPPPVLVLRDEEGSDYLDRLVWLSFRLQVFHSGQDVAAVAALAAARMAKHVDWIRAIVSEAQGAIEGWKKALPREVVTGWAGEVVARAKLDGGSLSYGPTWFWECDLQGTSGERVEVKTTVLTEGGEAYWSRTERALAARVGADYRLVFVRVDAAIIADLVAALKEPKARADRFPEPEVDARRLEQALWLNGCEFLPPLAEVKEAIERLLASTPDIRVTRNPIREFGLEHLHPAVETITLAYDKVP